MCLLFACTSQETDSKINEYNEIDLGKVTLDISYDPVTTLDLNEYDLDQVLTDLAKELYDIDFTDPKDEASQLLEANPDASGEAFVIVDVRLNFNDNVLTITPTLGVTPVLLSDDTDCGGKTGDGWTSYGVCYNEVCVEETMRTAMTELKKDLQTGKCIDVRVRRTLFNARVCARIISC
jgi:hypothetical protein